MSFLSEAIERLSSTPQQVEALARGLSDEQLSRKPKGDFFSIRESVLHLRDIDVEGYERRIHLILSEECPALPDSDGGKLARERNYNARPLQPALDDLRRSRTVSMQRLMACSEADLDRKAEMQGVGTVTLRRLLEMWMEHDRGHLADIVELCRVMGTDELPSLVEHSAA
jgi:hypothetical protein